MNKMNGANEEKLKTLWDGELPDADAAERLRERVMKEAKEAAGTDVAPDPVPISGGNRRMKLLAAACLILAFGIGGFSALRQYAVPPTYRYTDGTGETYDFPPAQIGTNSLHCDFPVVTRQLTAEESGSLFRSVSVREGALLANDDLVWRGSSDGGSGSSADAPDFSGGIANDDLVWREQPSGPSLEDWRAYIYEKEGLESVPDKSSDAEYVWVSSDDAAGGSSGEGTAIYGTFRQDTGELIRTEGKVGEIKIICAAQGIALTDVVVSSDGAVAEIAGQDVMLRSYTTPPNSRGARTAILCADFEIDAEDGEVWKAYAEAAGDVSEAEKIAGTLVETVRGMLSGPADFGSVRNSGE